MNTKNLPLQPGYKPLFPMFSRPAYESDLTPQAGGGYPIMQPNIRGVAVAIRRARPTALGMLRK